MTKKFKPIKEFSNKGTRYFTVESSFNDDGEAIEVIKWNFDGEDVDYIALDRGIAFENKKHAKRAAIFISNLMRELEPFPGCITSQPDEGAEVWVISLIDAPYCSRREFSQSNNVLQKFFKNHMLFSSEKDARAASKSILAALKAKVLRQNLNCLTEAPADGTPVYLSTFTPNGWLQYLFDSNSSHHMQLLELGLLFTSEEDAKRVFDILIQQINPTTPKAVPDVPAEPDAQADVPAERDDDSDE